ncbi:hypothetical protein [Romboutsia lituseburensis]|uniref:hypothetical protein n=1 Tax=Romboutsia lituseburensis TaxID=1537 RepID=UPI00215AF016|nr:hypothetical protein [Romboutsia lituseburensis]MCR8743748.1 hypothetical protein [Romboutsia lituseburensis]
MKGNKKFYVLICISCIVIMGSAVALNFKNKDLSLLQESYFNLIHKDVRGENILSNELNDLIPDTKVENIPGSVALIDSTKNNSNLTYSTNNFEFTNKDEFLVVSYIDTNTKTLDKIDSISYNVNKGDNNYLNTSYSKLNTNDWKLDLSLNLRSLDEQEQCFEVVNKLKDVNYLYEVYFNIARTIENDTKISISDIELLLNNKKLKKIKNGNNNDNRATYLYEINDLKLYIDYDLKSNKCINILLKSCNTGDINLSYYKDTKDGISLWKCSKNVKEQNKIIKDLVKYNKSV